MLEDNSGIAITKITAEIIAAYVSHNPVSSGELPHLIAQVYASLASLQPGSAPVVVPVETKPRPAVSIRKSITPDYLICLEDGKKFKSLKRHLITHYQLTPKEYREKWNLPVDYPMVAPNYAAARSALAKKMGLGRNHKMPEPVKKIRKRVA